MKFHLYRDLKSLSAAALVLFAFYTFIIATVTPQIQWGAGLSSLAKLIYIDRFYCDFFIALAVASLFYGKNLARLLSGFILSLFLFIYFLQVQSYSVSGQFLPAIALENMEHTESLNLVSIYSSAAIWLALFLFSCGLAHKVSQTKTHFAIRAIFALACVFTAILINNDKYFISDKAVTNRLEFYNSGLAGFPHSSPLSEFIKTVKDYRSYLHIQKRISDKKTPLSNAASQFAFQHYAYLGQANREYPLQHYTQLENPSPFESISSANYKKDSRQPEKKNVIVFFIEGLSARIIQPYSQKLPNISPNINAFASQKTMRVDNYYNHTYATYRGLAGQLCSIYPIGRLLASTRYHCLPHILNNEGYATHFLYSQKPENTHLSKLFPLTGIANVDSATSLQQLLNDNIKDTSKLSNLSKAITDQELVLGLIEKLKIVNSTKHPFFMGLYNLETHTNTHLFVDKTTYSHPGIDSSYVLNTFHNFDKAFGLFWDYFKKSPHAKNTIVILTTDHATFSGRDYLELDIGAPRLFIDQIPLLIHHPDLQNNPVFDANNRTSIDFAPTLLNILGIKNQQTHFLGDSLFLNKDKKPPSVVRSGTAMWSMDKQNWFEVTAKVDNRVNLPAATYGAYDFYTYTSELESSNRLWKETKTKDSNNNTE